MFDLMIGYSITAIHLYRQMIVWSDLDIAMYNIMTQTPHKKN